MIEERIVAGAAVAIGDEPKCDRARTDRNFRACADQLPARAFVERGALHRAEHGGGGAEEGDADLAAVGRRLGEAAQPAGEDHFEIAQVELCRAVAFGDQIDHLLGKAFLDVAGGEIPAAFERGRIGAAHRAADVRDPAADARFEAGVGQQIDFGRRAQGIHARIGRIDGRAGEAQTGHRREQAIVAAARMQELRPRPGRIDDGVADRMQIEFRDIGLPVEHIDEVLGPVADAAAAGRVEVVVVAEEAGLAVVGDVEVVARLGPQDVAAHLDVGCAAAQADVVAARRVEGVLVHAHVGDAGDVQALLGVAVDEVVQKLQPCGCLDADGIVRDAAELHRAGETADAGAVALDEIGGSERIAADRAAAAHPGRILEHVLVLHARRLQLDADRVAVNLVRGRAGDEAERVRPGQRRAHAGAVAVDAIGCERRSGVVGHAHRGAVNVVVIDQPGKGSIDGKARAARADVVMGDAARSGRCNDDAAVAGETVVNDLEVGAAAQAQGRIDEFVVDQREAAGIGRVDLAAEADALQRDAARAVDVDAAAEDRILRPVADDGDAGIVRTDRDGSVVVARGEQHDIVGAERAAAEQGLQRRQVGHLVHGCIGERIAAQIDLRRAFVGRAPGDERTAVGIERQRERLHLARGRADAAIGCIAVERLREGASRPALREQRHRIVGPVDHAVVGPHEEELAARDRELRRGRESGGCRNALALRRVRARGHPGVAVEAAGEDFLAQAPLVLPGDEDRTAVIGDGGIAALADVVGEPVADRGIPRRPPGAAAGSRQVDLVIGTGEPAEGDRYLAAVSCRRVFGHVHIRVHCSRRLRWRHWCRTRSRRLWQSAWHTLGACRSCYRARSRPVRRP